MQQLKICPTCKSTHPAQLERCPADGTELEALGRPNLAWTAGRLIGGKYVIFAETSSTAIANCYRVRNLDLDEPRSLRALQPALATEKASAEEFRRAARLLGGIRHPNVVAVEFAGDAEDGVPFVVTEILPGRSLAELIEAEAPLPPRRVCTIARQIAAGLEAVHRHGLLHLGLSPSVIFVSGAAENETVKIEDFGADYVRIGRTSNGGRRSGLNLRDFMPANTLYCAPEQVIARHSESLDGRADLYSLGLIIFQMLTGRLPFTKHDGNGNGRDRARLESLVSHLEEPFALSPAENNAIPKPLANLISLLLEKRPQLRLAGARQVIEKLSLVEDWMAARALMGLSTAAAAASEKPAEVLHEKTAPPAVLEAETPRGVSDTSPVLPEPAPLIDAAPAGVVLAPVSEASLLRMADRSVPAAMEVPVLTGSIVKPGEAWKESDLVLFKTAPPPISRSRWLLAFAALLVIAAGAFLLITHGLKPGPGPLNPDKSDVSSTEQISPSTSKPAAPQSHQTAAPASSQAATQSSQAEPQASETAPASAPAAKPPDNSSARSAPETTTAPARAGSTASRSGPAKGAASDEIATEVQRAITTGDVFFEQGKYDLAIQAYERPLRIDPGNAKLAARVARARKAKAAEEEYLGQQ